VRLSTVQQAFIEHFSFQCGYCTLARVTAATVLVERLKTAPVARRDLEAAIDKAMGQHICRCTGYVCCFEAVRHLALATPGLVRG
jgi:aerobic-type carbon monoxide dehydrogenase small subunit (CoxS/CutS family)